MGKPDYCPDDLREDRPMQDLIERLQAATEGSRNLDDAIADAAGWGWTVKPGYSDRISPEGRVESSSPNYTTSIDAALTLVPEGFSTELIINEQNGLSAAHVTQDLTIPGGVRKTGSTPALALCIAALLARRETKNA